MGKKIKVEVQDRRIKNSLVINASTYAEARKQIEEFLVYVFRDEGYEKPYHSEFKPEYMPSWLVEYNLDDLSQKDKVYLLLRKNHPSEWVRSTDLQEEYETIFGEEIKLSSISTYLGRFYEHGAVERRGSRAQREYKLIGVGEGSI